MDLLKIDGRTINLDRLSAIVEIEDEVQAGEGQIRKSRRLQLVLGDTSITLDEKESNLFIDFIEQNYRIRKLGQEIARGSRGGIDYGQGTKPGVVPPKSGDAGS